MKVPSKTAFYLVYDEENEDPERNSRTTIARLGPDALLIERRSDGEIWGITTGGTHYNCSTNYWGGGYCSLLPYDGDPFAGLADSLFDFETIVKEAAGDQETTVVELVSRVIGGFDARCFAVTGGSADGEICVERESGLLLHKSGTFDGTRSSQTLASVREPTASDFELPFPLGEPSEADLAEWPRQDMGPSITSRRIAGSLFHWETAPPLCPELELPAYGSLLAVDDEHFLLGDDGIHRLVGPGCSVATLDSAVAQFFVDRSGALYYGEGSRSMDSIDSAHFVVRKAPDGTTSRLAGAECTPGVDCDFGLDGSAEKVVLGWIYWIGVGTDGALWFMEFIPDSGRFEEHYRLRYLGADGIVKSVATERSLNTVSAYPGPNGLLYIADSNAGGWLIDSSGAIVEDGLPGGLRAFAPGRDGDIWRYDQESQELVVRHASGSEQSFRFAPEADFWPHAIAVQPNGDLLVKSTAYTGRPGLWLVPNPLK